MLAGESRLAGISAPSKAARRSRKPETESAPKVLPCHERSRAMKRRRSGLPIAEWYCNAIFRQDSTASEPLEQKVMCFKPPPQDSAIIAVSSSKGSLVKV